MKPQPSILETMELCQRLKFYSDADELRISWDGNIISFRFEWHKPLRICAVSYTSEQVNSDAFDLETKLMEEVNRKKADRAS